MAKKLSNQHQAVFERIKRVDENKKEYWTAGDVSKALDYSEYRHFKSVIERAKEACINFGNKECGVLSVCRHMQKIKKPPPIDLKLIMAFSKL